MSKLQTITSIRRLFTVLLMAGLLTSGCGQHSPEASLASSDSSEPEDKPSHTKQKILVSSGAIAAGGIAVACLVVVKTKKACRKLFKHRHDTLEQKSAETLASVANLKTELNHLNASHGRLYEKFLNLQKEHSVFLGRQANVNGLLLEHVSTKEIPLILKREGINVLETIQSVKGQYRAKDNGIVKFEIDAIFLTDDSAYFLEAKNNLHRSHVEKFAENLSNFSKSDFNHSLISEKIQGKKIKGVISYVFDSSLPNQTTQQGKSASSYAFNSHGIRTIKVFSWQEFRQHP